MKKYVVILLVVLLCGALFYGCNFNKTFDDFEIGDQFSSNRDCYRIKLNTTFFALSFFDGFNENQTYIYKLNDLESPAILDNSDLYYSGLISKCYCNENNILAYSQTNDNYVLIDCNNIDNIQLFDTLDETGLDLSAFTEIIIDETT